MMQQPSPQGYQQQPSSPVAGARCPTCGQVVGAAVQTIEQTSKGLKLQVLLSTLLVFAGAIVSVVATTNDIGALVVVGGSAFVVGLIWFTIARVLIWWRHK